MADGPSFIRTEEQAMLASTLRDMLAASVDMDAVREMSLTSDAVDRGTWRALSEMGLVGLILPEEHGGAGSPFTDLAIVFEELGRVVAPVPLLSTVMAGVAIDRAGTDAQRATLLPRLASGETIATLAVFETPHQRRGDESATTAARIDGGWRLTGVKRYVTDAPNADLVVVSADVGGDTGLFVVPTDADGVSVTALPALDATRPLGDIDLDATVADDAFLGGEAHGAALDHALDVGVVALAQEQVGGARRCLESSVDYATTRYQFGRAIGSFQAIKHLCADMLVAVEHARSVAWHAASSLGDPDEARIAVPLAKSVCSDAYVKVAGDTIQVHGGIGFTWEHDAHLYLKRAKASSLLFGSVGSYRDRLGDAIGV